MLCRMLFPAFLLLTVGCIEQTQVVTLNPDGKGKVEFDIKMPGESTIFGGANPNAKEKSVEEILQDAVTRTLTKDKKVAAWKDVSAKWTADGRLHFAGTVYFNHLNDLWERTKGQPASDLNFEQFELTIDKDKGLKLALYKQDSAKLKVLPDFAKMTDKEMDEHVLKQRIKYQSVKGVMVAMFTDLKIRTTIHLPGDVQEGKGFKKTGARVVTRNLDGVVILDAMNKTMAQDNAALRKFLKSAKTAAEAESFGVSEFIEGATLTVPKLAEPLFDYDKEVKAARDAYPALRKQWNLSEKVKLPGE